MTGVHANSIAAYQAEKPRLSKRAQLVLEYITETGPQTDRQVMRGMGFGDPNSVRPRITELVERGLLMEVGDVKCRETGKTVRRVDIRRARQEVLFS